MHNESTNPSKKHSGEYLHHSLVLEFISETGVRDFSELIDYVAKNDQAMFKTVFDNYAFYVTYLKSKWRKEISAEKTFP
jgi:hypothetical protein